MKPRHALMIGHGILELILRTYFCEESRRIIESSPLAEIIKYRRLQLFSPILFSFSCPVREPCYVPRNEMHMEVPIIENIEVPM